MSAKPVQISLDQDLLVLIDSDAETREEGRSAFIRAAVRHYLDEKRRRAIDEQIRAAYAGKADELEADISGLIDGQAWPAD